MSQPDPVSLLAQDFPPADFEQWRALVDKALKGASFAKRLVTRTADGLALDPLYTPKDALPEAPAPGQLPLVRGRKAEASGFGWDILTLIEEGNPHDANRAILEDLEGGSNGVLIQLAAPAQTGVELKSQQDAAQLLAGVHLDLASVAFKGGAGSLAWAGHVIDALPALGGTQGQRRLALNLDPIGTLARLGTAGQPIAQALVEAVAIAGKLHAAETNATSLLVDGTIAHEAGGSEGQELAFMAACLVAYLKAFDDAGVAPEAALPQIAVALSADTDIFLTTAKFRAARQIVARIAEACGAGTVASAVSLGAVTSARMMTRVDPYTNVLRTTVATSGAAFGGADAILVLPFTHALGAPTAFSRRLARNSQIVAQEESNLGRVVDPAGGSWYVEQTTQQLAARAWDLFQHIEKEGGIVAALASGNVQDQIEQTVTERAKAIATGRIELTGVTTFPNLAPDGIDVAARTTPTPILVPLEVKILAPISLAAPFEHLRAASATAPKVFLASLGSVAEHTSRANYILNLLASGGISCVAPGSVETAQEAASAFATSGCSVAVLASSDAVYATHAVDTARSLKAAGAGHVALAGRPGEHEAAWREAGVDSFIFAGQDRVALLTELHGLSA